MIKTKTFILGVGAQKSGTSWLYEYLVSSKNVARTPLKEYHVWDALYINCCKRKFIQSKKVAHTQQEKVRFPLQQSTDLYFNHFLELLRKTSKTNKFLELFGKTPKSITCDITPSYAGLNRDVFNYIIAQFQEVEVSTKAIFLMRDPIERCWSASRMKNQQNFGHTDVKSETVLVNVMTEAFEMRTRYDLTIEELEAAFEQSKLFIGLYERLGDIDQLRSLSNFCGVELRQKRLNRKLNVSPKVSKLDTDVAKQIAVHYRPVYEYVAQKMPVVERLWEGFKYI